MAAMQSISRLDHQLLLPIYRNIHDPDMLYGLEMSSSLQLQAIMFAHKGRWVRH